MVTAKTPVWLDCDPGHDDAFALLLAGWHPSLDLIGVSTVAGNDTLEHTTQNARRVLFAGGLRHVTVVQGAAAPLLRAPRTCPEVHGDSGLDGAELPTPGPDDARLVPGPAAVRMYESMHTHVEAGGKPVTLIATGSLTNVALLIALYGRDALSPLVSDLVLMGGAVGRGNTGPSAEFNIQVDPEAAAMVFASGLPVTMVPLDVTHTALVTPEVMRAVAQGRAAEDSDAVDGARNSPLCVSHAAAYPYAQREAAAPSSEAAQAAVAGVGGGGTPASVPLAHAAAAGCGGASEIARMVAAALDPASLGGGIAGQAPPECSSPFRAALVGLLRFFACSYRDTFAMAHPPLHDPVAVAWVAAGAAAAVCPPAAATGSGPAPPSLPAASPLPPDATSPPGIVPGAGGRGAMFASRPARVEVETASPYTFGQTVVDLHGVAPGACRASSPAPAGRRPKCLADGLARSAHDDGLSPNARVVLAMDVQGFWGMMLQAVAAADGASPMNPACG